MSPSATLATQNAGICRQVLVCDKDGVWKMVVDKDVCERWWLTKLRVKDGVWLCVCERWCVTKMCVRDGGWRWCVTKICARDGGWQSYVWKMVCGCVWKMVCDKDVCVRDGGWMCVRDGGWQACVWKIVCERWWLTKMCVKDTESVWEMVVEKEEAAEAEAEEAPGAWTRWGHWHRGRERWPHGMAKWYQVIKIIIIII